MMEINPENKQTTKRVVKLSLLFLWLLVTYFVASSEHRTKQVYVDQFFSQWSSVQQLFFGIFQFSIGDVLYGCVFGFCIWKLFRFLHHFIFKKKQERWKYLGKTLFKNTQIVLWIYLIFLWSWALNYYRPGVGAAFSISPALYTKEELIQLNEDLLHQLNQDSAVKPAHFDEMVVYSNRAYNQLLNDEVKQKKKDYLVKPSIYSPVIAYLGISGYYNPFTGEAQIDQNYPDALKPFLVSHEMAHQLGYAKEDEANFMAYLSAETSKNKSLKYASNVQMFLYTNRILFQADSVLAKESLQKLPNQVKRDIRALYRYYNERKNPVEPLFTWVYDVFLTRHQQPKGMITYQEVISLVIDYRRKHQWQKH
jgi:hypothetical protein